MEKKKEGGAIATMDIGRMDCRSAERFGMSRVDGHLWSTDSLQDPRGIDRGVFQGGIAVDRGDSEQVQGWMMGGDENRKRILDSVR